MIHHYMYAGKLLSPWLQNATLYHLHHQIHSIIQKGHHQHYLGKKTRFIFNSNLQDLKLNSSNIQYCICDNNNCNDYQNTINLPIKNAKQAMKIRTLENQFFNGWETTNMIIKLNQSFHYDHDLYCDETSLICNAFNTKHE